MRQLVATSGGRLLGLFPFASQRSVRTNRSVSSELPSQALTPSRRSASSLAIGRRLPGRGWTIKDSGRLRMIAPVSQRCSRRVDRDEGRPRPMLAEAILDRLEDNLLLPVRGGISALPYSSGTSSAMAECYSSGTRCQNSLSGWCMQCSRTSWDSRAWSATSRSAPSGVGSPITSRASSQRRTTRCFVAWGFPGGLSEVGSVSAPLLGQGRLSAGQARCRS